MAVDAQPGQTVPKSFENSSELNPSSASGLQKLPARPSVSTVVQRLVLPVYLPVVAGTIATGMLVPVLPLYLTSEGFSLRTTSLVLAAAGFGSLIGGLPVGKLLSRTSERKVLGAALIVIAISTALLGVVAALALLVALRLAFGASAIGIRLGSQTWVTRRVQSDMRGRALSFIGGASRLSTLIGALIGGAMVDLTGYPVTFGVAGALSAIGLIPLVVGSSHEPPDANTQSPLPGAAEPQVGMLASLRLHRKPLLNAGVVPFVVLTSRQGRLAVLPLISSQVGLSPSAVGAVVGIGAGADLVLFPFSGWVMDRYGRLFGMVPAFSLFAAGLVVLGFADSALTIVLAGVLLGVGNGMSAGSMLTLGSDLAPPDEPAPFLAGFAVFQDLGKIAGPLIVGMVGAAVGLGRSAFVLAALMALAIGWLVLVIGETADRQTDR